MMLRERNCSSISVIDFIGSGNFEFIISQKMTACMKTNSFQMSVLSTLKLKPFRPTKRCSNYV